MSFLTLIRNTVAALAALALLPAQAVAQENPLVPEAPLENVQPIAEAMATVDPTRGLHALTRSDVDAWLDGFMPYAIETGDIVGAVVTVVKDGEILTSRGFGYADLEIRKPVDGAETLFRPGSISKLFTWTAVMQLVEQGKVDLDEDINTYLDFKIPDAFDAPITVRHLLTHTAGFEETAKNLIISDPEKLLSLGDYLKDTIPARMFAPGETPAYSNYGTALAGYIVERVSGETFDDYIDANIFTPLGMKHSTFRQPLPEKYEEAMSSGYKNAADGEAGYYELVVPAPAGALAATGPDMGRFMIAHLNDGGPLLKPETARQMHETYDTHTPPLHAMALGFYQQDVNSLRSIGHGGDTVFFHSDLHLFLDKDVGIFVSVNSSGAGAGELRSSLAANFAERYFAEAAYEYEERLDTAKEHADFVAGVYEGSRSSKTTFFALTRFLGQFKVSATKEGDLLLPTGATPTRWREVEPFVWRKVGGTDRFAAHLNEDGAIDHVTFEPMSPFMQFLPPPWYRSSSILTPLLLAALAALLATFVLWPVRAIVRWRYKSQFPLTGREAMSYRLVRVGTFLVFVVLAAWAMVIQTLSGDLAALAGDAFIMQLRTAQFGQVFLYAAFVLAAWSLFVVWQSKQSWFAKLWSAALLASTVIVIWFAAISGLLHIGVNF